MRIHWFEGEKQDIEIPQDKFANFNRFNQSQIESTNSDYKPIIDFSPNYLSFSIKSIIPFRDFLFHGTTCQFIHQLVNLHWILFILNLNCRLNIGNREKLMKELIKKRNQILIQIKIKYYFIYFGIF